MRARLSGGHFRMLNEKLYTCRFTLYPPHLCLVDVLAGLNAILSVIAYKFETIFRPKNLHFKDTWFYVSLDPTLCTNTDNYNSL